MTYNELLEKVKISNKVIKSFGIDVIEKGIPDDERSGVLDKRELECIIEDSKVKVDKTIESIREHTGSPGKNINYSHVNEKRIAVDFETPYTVFEYTSQKPKVHYENSDRPAILYIHGGSWFAGTPDIVKNACFNMAEKSGAVVYNIEYALAPEYPFPVAINQIVNFYNLLAKEHIKFGINPSKIVIAGDSAGGNLAASVANLVDVKPALVALWYPAVILKTDSDLYEWKISDYSISDEQKAYIIPKLILGRSDTEQNLAFTKWIVNMYINYNEALCDDPRVSPVYADLTNYPKTVIFTSEFDGLRPQGELFAKVLRDFNRDVTIYRYRGICHAFIFKTGILPQAEDSIDIVVEEINKL